MASEKKGKTRPSNRSCPEMTSSSFPKYCVLFHPSLFQEFQRGAGRLYTGLMVVLLLIALQAFASVSSLVSCISSYFPGYLISC